VKKGLSVRETEQLVRRVLANQEGKKRKTTSAAPNADIRRLEVDISGKLGAKVRGAKVRIEHTKKGTGKVVINYNNLAELDGILKHIK
jgi:ParB family chromosome partitioning protein